MTAAPAPKVRRIIRYSPLHSQGAFHEARALFKGFSGPVGSGKSLALANEALRLSVLNPGLPGLIGAPTYRMLADTTQLAFLELLADNDIPFRRVKVDNKVILTDFGTEISFRSLENPDRLRGTNLAWFGVDELTFCKESAYLRLQARLRHPKATQPCGFAVWTPNGFDWVYSKFIDKPTSDYHAVLAKPFENVHLRSGYYGNLATSYSDRFYRQEALGEYLNITSGACYYAFDRKHNVQPVQYDPALPLCWTMDFNLNPMCSLIAQIVPKIGNPLQAERVNVLREIRLPQSNTPAAVEEFLNVIEDFRRPGQTLHVKVFGDAAGSNRSTTGAGSPSDWGTVKRELANVENLVATYHYKKSHMAVKDRVAAVNNGLRNSVGEHRVFIHPRCEYLIVDMEQVTWKEGSAQIDKGKNHDLTHLSDAAGYLLEQYFHVNKKRKYGTATGVGSQNPFGAIRS